MNSFVVGNSGTQINTDLYYISDIQTNRFFDKLCLFLVAVSRIVYLAECLISLLSGFWYFYFPILGNSIVCLHVSLSSLAQCHCLFLCFLFLKLLSVCATPNVSSVFVRVAMKTRCFCEIGSVITTLKGFNFKWRSV